MISQTRQQISDKLQAAEPQVVTNAYQLLLLELILDVLVDIRDSMQTINIETVSRFNE